MAILESLRTILVDIGQFASKCQSFDRGTYEPQNPNPNGRHDIKTIKNSYIIGGYNTK
jgi:hypothetical protein